MQSVLIIVVSVGLVAAVANCLVRKFIWKQEPELSAFIEILLSSIGVWIAIKVGKLAVMLPATEVSDEDKIYFCLGSVALTWVSLATILRKFKRPYPIRN